MTSGPGVPPERADDGVAPVVSDDGVAPVVSDDGVAPVVSDDGVAPVVSDDDMPDDRRFGEQGGRLTYGGYLHLEALLSAQELRSDPPAHDELLFITVHQVYELWFQQVLHELDAVRSAMTEDRLWQARHLLRRVARIEQVLVHQLEVLETMTPHDFLVFRDRLAPASGFQSVQFREIEFVSGHQDPAFLERFRGLTDDERSRLTRRLAEPTLWDAFVGALGRAGLPTGDDDQIREALLVLARSRAAHAEVWELGEALLEHDEQCAHWRARHVQMVERQIGSMPGTGGSAGAPYLRGRLPMRFYPLLWDVRGRA